MNTPTDALDGFFADDSARRFSTDAAAVPVTPIALDFALAALLVRQASAPPPWLRGLIVHLSAAVRLGHTCVALTALLAGMRADSEFPADLPQTPAELLRQLQQCDCAGEPGSEAALISDGSRLYLRRYFEYERAVASGLVARYRMSFAAPTSTKSARIARELNALFPRVAGDHIDWQCVAAALALQRRLCVILGGPGSGKTWTVLRLLELITRLSDRPLRIALAAPTGKAAARVSEGLQRNLAEVDRPGVVPTDLPRVASTLHRLLGMRPNSSQPRFDANNPLPLDVLVLDEASMIDLPSMAHLLAALPAHAQLILLGDPDQLASVEIGNVLAELRSFNTRQRYSPPLLARLAQVGLGGIDAAPAAARFGDTVVTLQRNHRFDAHSGIGRLVQAIQHGDADTACAILRGDVDLTWHELEFDAALTCTLDIATAAYAGIAQAASAASAIAALAQFRVLGALREGPWGTRRINAALVRAQLGLSPWQPLPEHFAGAPLLIRENDHVLRLYNGDSGVLWPGTDGRLRAWFTDARGLRTLAPNQLPAFELGYAMTVHKAQGSEYARVAVLLPPPGHMLLSREWLYTAVSRAREGLVLIGAEATLRAAIERPGQRGSGLSSQIAGLLQADSDAPASA